MIQALFDADIYVKQVIVVDSDTDVSDLRQVATAVALHTRPDRDLTIRHSQGTELDPACESSDGQTAKIGIDATVPLAKRSRITRNRIPQEIIDSIDLADLLRPTVRA